MHRGLKIKTTKEQEEENLIREREKAYHLKHLCDRMFKLRPLLQENTQELLKITTEILLINPDIYTAWNVRRECLLASEDTNWTRSELNFTMDCLKRNEKSYSVWQGRIWVLAQMEKSEYDSEILLCNSFLMKDERNFHCWDYRSYICDLAGFDLQKELQFTTDKIRSNFSNFSAWHRRHIVLLKALSLPQEQCPNSCDIRLIWKQEYDFVLNALFTDPSDQSPWLYHNWLVKNNHGFLGEEQLEKLRALQELEPDNKRVEGALQLAIKCVG